MGRKTPIEVLCSQSGTIKKVRSTKTYAEKILLLRQTDPVKYEMFRLKQKLEARRRRREMTEEQRAKVREQVRQGHRRRRAKIKAAKAAGLPVKKEKVYPKKPATEISRMRTRLNNDAARCQRLFEKMKKQKEDRKKRVSSAFKDVATGNSESNPIPEIDCYEIPMTFEQHEQHMASFLKDIRLEPGPYLIISQEQYAFLVDFLKDPKKSYCLQSFKNFVSKNKLQLRRGTTANGVVQETVVAESLESTRLTTVLPDNVFYSVVSDVHIKKFNHQGGFRVTKAFLDTYFFGVTALYVWEFCRSCPLCHVGTNEQQQNSLRLTNKHFQQEGEFVFFPRSDGKIELLESLDREFCFSFEEEVITRRNKKQKKDAEKSGLNTDDDDDDDDDNESDEDISDSDENDDSDEDESDECDTAPVVNEQKDTSSGLSKRWDDVGVSSSNKTDSSKANTSVSTAVTDLNRQGDAAYAGVGGSSSTPDLPTPTSHAYIGPSDVDCRSEVKKHTGHDYPSSVSSSITPDLSRQMSHDYTASGNVGLTSGSNTQMGCNYPTSAGSGLKFDAIRTTIPDYTSSGALSDLNRQAGFSYPGAGGGITYSGSGQITFDYTGSGSLGSASTGPQQASCSYTGSAGANLACDGNRQISFDYPGSGGTSSTPHLNTQSYDYTGSGGMEIRSDWSRQASCYAGTGLRPDWSGQLECSYPGSGVGLSSDTSRQAGLDYPGAGGIGTTPYLAMAGDYYNPAGYVHPVSSANTQPSSTSLLTPVVTAKRGGLTPGMSDVDCAPDFVSVPSFDDLLSADTNKDATAMKAIPDSKTNRPGDASSKVTEKDSSSKVMVLSEKEPPSKVVVLSDKDASSKVTVLTEKDYTPPQKPMVSLLSQKRSSSQPLNQTSQGGGNNQFQNQPSGSCVSVSKDANISSQSSKTSEQSAESKKSSKKSKKRGRKKLGKKSKKEKRVKLEEPKLPQTLTIHLPENVDLRNQEVIMDISKSIQSLTKSSKSTTGSPKKETLKKKVPEISVNVLKKTHASNQPPQLTLVVQEKGQSEKEESEKQLSEKKPPEKKTQEKKTQEKKTSEKKTSEKKTSQKRQSEPAAKTHRKGQGFNRLPKLTATVHKNTADTNQTSKPATRAPRKKRKSQPCKRSQPVVEEDESSDSACQPAQASSAIDTVGLKLMDRVQVDVVDFSSTPDHHFHFICHVIDRFSKFRVLFPLKDSSASEIATGLRDRVFSCFGPPKTIHGNSGGQCVNDALSLLKKQWPSITLINKSTTRCFISFEKITQELNVELDASFEKLTQELNADLNKDGKRHAEEREFRWSEHLAHIMLSLNQRAERPTVSSPYSIVFGHDPY